MTKIKLDNTELRARLRLHWKQKIKYAYKYFFYCSLTNKFCDKCKEERVCLEIRTKSWLPIGKL
jgi:hypothetical protein